MTETRPRLSDLPNWPRLLSAEQAAAYVGVSRNAFEARIGNPWPKPRAKSRPKSGCARCLSSSMVVSKPTSTTVFRPLLGLGLGV